MRVEQEPTVDVAQGGSKRRRWPLVLVPIVISAVVIAVALARGQEVSKVDIPKGVIEFSAAADERVSEDQVDRAGLDRVAADLKQEAQAKAEAQPVSRARMNVTGTWVGTNGLQYRFDQQGDYVVFQEITQLGVAAAGAGLVRNTRLLGEYTAVNAMTGMVDLQLQPDGSLAGAFVLSNGSSAPIAMYYRGP